MIHVYCFDASEKKGTWRGPEVLTDGGGAHVLWIDLEMPTPEEERLVFEKYFHIHPLTLEDITHLREFSDGFPHLPKVEEFNDYLFVIVNPIHPATYTMLQHQRPLQTDTPLVTQLSAVLTGSVLITHHAVELYSVRETRDAVSRGAIQCDRGPDYLFHLILDKVVDFYAPVVDCVENHIDDIEVAVFHNPTTKLFHRILTFKQIVAGLRKSLMLEREVVVRLSRAEFTLITDREAVYYRNVLDHLTRFVEMIELSREQTHDLMEMHLASQSNRMNEIMKVLTIISTITLPMTLIAGIYGMNYNLYPSNADGSWWKDVGGFWFAIGLMVLAGIVPLAVFKWRKWF
jgi:magnesium transporter